jgi:hypothetical protein
VAGAATSSQTWTPTGVAVDGAGNVYVTLEVPSDIVEITPGGQLSVVAGTGSSGAPTYGGPASASSLNGPDGIYAESDGTLLVADYQNNTIDRIGAATPEAPQDVALTAQDSSAVLSFQAPIDPGSSAITSYQVSLDGGSTWQTITTSNNNGTLSATLSALTDGTTYNVLVRAVNGSGAGTDSSAASVTLPAPTSTTTTTTATGTTTTTTGTTTGPAVDAVQVPSATVAAGLTASAAGVVALPLACPTTAVAGCDAGGILTITLQGANAADVAPIHSSVIARFSGIEIQAGHSRLVAVKLSPQAISYLRAHDISRVRVTLTTHNSLSDGQVVTSAQSLWLYVSALTGCHLASGAISAHGVGRLSLGMTRVLAHKTGHYTVGRGKWENYCVTGGKIQAAYPHHTHTAARIVMILTANHHYAIAGVHAGASLKTARAKLPIRAGIRVENSTWYFLQGAHVTRVLQARHGRIVRVGVVNRKLTTTRALQRQTVRSLR